MDRLLKARAQYWFLLGRLEKARIADDLVPCERSALKDAEERVLETWYSATYCSHTPNDDIMLSLISRNWDAMMDDPTSRARILDIALGFQSMLESTATRYDY